MNTNWMTTSTLTWVSQWALYPTAKQFFSCTNWSKVWKTMIISADFKERRYLQLYKHLLIFTLQWSLLHSLRKNLGKAKCQKSAFFFLHNWWYFQWLLTVTAEIPTLVAHCWCVIKKSVVIVYWPGPNSRAMCFHDLSMSQVCQSSLCKHSTVGVRDFFVWWK